MTTEGDRFGTEQKLQVNTANHSVLPESARSENHSPTERQAIPQTEEKEIEDAIEDTVQMDFSKEEVEYKGECHRWLIIIAIVLG